MLPPFSIYVFASLLSLTTSLPAPTFTPTPPPVSAFNSVIQCTPTQNQDRLLNLPPPTLQSCAFALRALPSFQDMGIFHVGGNPDTFRLPVEQTYGSCTVSVELAGGHQRETGSWMEVGLAANQVNMACVDPAEGASKMGGWTTSGRANGVVVTIRENMDGGK